MHWLLLTLFACGSTVDPVDPPPPVPQSPASGGAPAAAQAGEAAPPATSVASDPVPQALPTVGLANRPVGLVNGDFAVDFTLPDLRNGGTWTLSEHIGPEVVGLRGLILSFSASWCGPCRASLPQLAELEKEHGEDLLVLIVSIDKTEAGRRREVADVTRAGLRGPVLHADEATMAAWLGGRRNIPHLYLINAIGEVLVQDRGYGKNVRRVLPGQVSYVLRHPDYVVR